MPDWSSRSRMNEATRASLALRVAGRSTRNLRGGLAKLASTECGSRSPRERAMSSRTAFVAVAVSAITGGRAGRASMNSMMRW